MKGKAHQPKPPLSRRRPRKSLSPRKAISRSTTSDEVDYHGGNSQTHSPKSSKCVNKTNDMNAIETIPCSRSKAFDFDYESDDDECISANEPQKRSTKIDTRLGTSSRYKKSQNALKNINTDSKGKKRKVAKSIQIRNSTSDEDDFADKPMKKRPCLSGSKEKADILTKDFTDKFAKKPSLKLKRIKKTQQEVSIKKEEFPKDHEPKASDQETEGYNSQEFDPQSVPTVFDSQQNKEKTSDNDKDDNTKGKNATETMNLLPTNENDKLVPCPVCNKAFDPSVVSQHANNCLDSQTEDESDTNSCQQNKDGKSSASLLHDQLVAYEYQNKKNPNQDLEEGDLLFCQICFKDLSKMNTQRRTQHINKCCDRVEDVETAKTQVSVNSSDKNNLCLLCPVCQMQLKTRKGLLGHVKKCGPKHNIPNDQLLEIKRQIEAVELSSQNKVKNAKSNPLQPKKRTNITKTLRGVDEETQLALALSASMVHNEPAENDGLMKTKKKKRNKKDEVIPAFLLRSKEETHSVIAARAAEVICNAKKDDSDEEISCTPALKPSSLLHKYTKDSNTSEKDISPPKSQVLAEKTANDLQNNQKDGIVVSFSEVKENIDMCQSFLSFLTNDEESETQTCTKSKLSCNGKTSLWSMAALDDSNHHFYVPNLLPVVSSKLPRKTPRRTPSKRRKTSLVGQQIEKQDGGNLPQQVFDNTTNILLQSKETEKVPLTSTSNEDCVTNQSNRDSPTSSQAANLDILMELADISEDDDEQPTQARKSSCQDDDNDVLPSSGFFVPINGSSPVDKVVTTTNQGVDSLVQDMSAMVGNPLLSDVTIATKGNQSIAAHSFMLASRCKVFAEMITSVRMENGGAVNVDLTFDDVELEAMQCLLYYLYAARLNVPPYLTIAVKQLAERLDLIELSEMCTALSESSEDYNPLSNKVVEQAKPTLTEDLLNAIWEKETGNSELKEYEDSHEPWEGFDDNEIEEVRIFQTQSSHKKQRMPEEQPIKEPASNFLDMDCGLDVVENLEEKQTNKDQTVDEPKHNSLNALKESLGVVNHVKQSFSRTEENKEKEQGVRNDIGEDLPDNELYDNGARFAIAKDLAAAITKDISSFSEHALANHRENIEQTSHENSLDEFSHTEDVADDIQSNKSENIQDKTKKSTADVQNPSKLCEMPLDALQDTMYQDIAETTDDDIYLENVLPQNTAYQFNSSKYLNFNDSNADGNINEKERIPDKPTKDQMGFFDDETINPDIVGTNQIVCSTGSQLSKKPKDVLKSTEESKYMDIDDKSSNGNSDDDGMDHGHRQNQNVQEAVECSEERSKANAHSRNPMDNLSNSIEETSDTECDKETGIPYPAMSNKDSMYGDDDDYDGNVAILSQSISLLSDSDNEKGIPLEEVPGCIVPETPCLKSKAANVGRNTTNVSKSSKNVPSSGTNLSSENSPIPEDSDSASDAGIDEDGDDFLNKLRANINTKSKRVKEKSTKNSRLKTKRKSPGSRSSSGRKKISTGGSDGNSCRSPAPWKESSRGESPMVTLTPPSTSLPQGTLCDFQEDGNYTNSFNYSPIRVLSPSAPSPNYSPPDSPYVDLEDPQEEYPIPMRSPKNTDRVDLTLDGERDENKSTEDNMGESAAMDCNSESEKSGPTQIPSSHTIEIKCHSKRSVENQRIDDDSPSFAKSSKKSSRNSIEPEHEKQVPVESLANSFQRDLNESHNEGYHSDVNEQVDDFQDSQPKDNHDISITNPVTVDDFYDDGNQDISMSNSVEVDDFYDDGGFNCDTEYMNTDSQPHKDLSSLHEVVNIDDDFYDDGGHNCDADFLGQFNNDSQPEKTSSVASNRPAKNDFQTGDLKTNNSQPMHPVSVSHQFQDDCGIEPDVNELTDCPQGELTDCPQGDDSFMANAADQIEKLDLERQQTNKDFTPIGKKQITSRLVGIDDAPSPITPIPDFQNMATPELRNEVSKYGIRPLPKKKMVIKLKQIHLHFQEVKHGKSSAEIPEEDSNPPPNSRKFASSQLKAASESNDNAPSQHTTGRKKNNIKNNKISLKEKGKAKNSIDIHLQETCAVDELDTVAGRVGENIGADTEESDEENEEFGEVSVLIDNEAMPSQQPLDFMALHDQIKSDGIQCSAGKLLDFLDEQCISFTTAGQKPRRTRKKAAKKK